MWTEDVSRTVLDNGVTLLAHRDASAPVLSVVTHMRAGYLNEADPVVGISHVLEHMYFKHATIADDVQRMGGYVNAGTIYDKTVYYTVVPSAAGALGNTVQLHAQALIHLDVDSGELARELEVIIQEANRKKDSPTAVTIETLYNRLYGQHRIRRWRIGTEELLRGFTRDDLLEFYRTFYTPERTIVALVGDLDPDEAIATASREFGSWRGDEVRVAPEPVEEEPPGATFHLLHGDVKRVISTVGWRTKGGLTEDVAALDMAAAVLGAGKGSLLGRAVRDPGLAASAAAHHYTLADVGVFDLFFESAPATADGAIRRALEIVAALGAGGLDTDDLLCARALTSARWSRRLEATDGLASMLCEFEALGGYRQMDDWFRMVMSVSADQICDAVSRILRIEEATSVVYAPHGVESGFEAEVWPPVVGPTPADPAPLPVRTVGPGSLTPAPRREYPDGTVHVDLAGVDLLVKAKRGTGLAFLGLYADTMRALEARECVGISSLLLRTSLRGAAGLSAGELSRFAESLGGSATPVMMLGWTGWGLSVRAESLGAASEMMLDVALRPTLEESAFQTERALLASDAARARDDMSGYPTRCVIERGLPESWYGRPATGEPETVEALTLDAIRDWSELLGQRRLTVIVVGDAPVEELIAQVHRFERWPRADRQAHPLDPFRWTPSRTSEVRDKAQSAIAMAFPAGVYHSPDRFPLAVMAAMLSGLSGRLFRELRDERSLAYSVSASAWLRSRAGALLTYIATSPEREDEARDSMLASLERFVEAGFTEEELIRARNYVAGQIQLRQQSTFAIAGDVLSSWLYGDLESIEETPDRLKAVTPDEIGELAARVLKPEARAEFTLRGGVPGAGQ